MNNPRTKESTHDEKGQGASAVAPEASSANIPAYFEGLMAEFDDIGRSLAASLWEIDFALLKARKSLALLQRSREGRIDIKFWTVSRTNLTDKQPTPVRYTQMGPWLKAEHLAGAAQKATKVSADGLKHPDQRVYLPKRIPADIPLSKAASRQHIYRGDRAHVVELLRVIERCLESRKRLLSSIGHLRGVVELQRKAVVDRAIALTEFIERGLPEWQVSMDEAEREQELRIAEHERLLAERAMAMAKKGARFD